MARQTPAHKMSPLDMFRPIAVELPDLVVEVSSEVRAPCGDTTSPSPELCHLQSEVQPHPDVRGVWKPLPDAMMQQRLTLPMTVSGLPTILPSDQGRTSVLSTFPRLRTSRRRPRRSITENNLLTFPSFIQKLLSRKYFIMRILKINLTTPM